MTSESAVELCSIQDDLTHALDRLALGFESADPNIRCEAKRVANQEFRDLASKIGEQTAAGKDS